MTIDDDAPDLEKYDDMEHKQQRLHCWVLIRRGMRHTDDTIFIEPTTGRPYSPQDSPYQRIEGIFNHENFWVNLYPNREVKKVSLELNDSA
jgi:hypothetical protein